ncbi:MAG: class I SAM-dependent methyltransferase [Pseudanabaena sp. CAN_BIN31]|nr:class I SAM-dependent methyltransferase [Pseudanabaena sp. CAN_BIN31]
MENTSKSFYDRQYTSAQYAEYETPPYLNKVQKFLNEVDEHRKASSVLEVGCGRGHYRHLHPNWIGTDYSEEGLRMIEDRPVFVSDAQDLSMVASNSIDILWSITVLEHIPQPELALAEFERVLKPGGYLFLLPAWQCRWWDCFGISVRKYRDLPLHFRLIKLLLPFLNSIAYRSLTIMPLRLYRRFSSFLSQNSTSYYYRKLPADYETFWIADSDACSWLDAHETILWFISRGHTCISHPSAFKQILIRSGEVIFKIIK